MLLLSLFESKAVQQGAVIRRKVWGVERLAGRDASVAELNRRGIRAVESAGQFVIFCNSEPIVRMT